MSQHLGIDIGGNHVKMGFVDSEGNISDFQSYSTASWREGDGFVNRLSETIAFKLVQHRGVTHVGIGLPGTLTKDRTTCVDIPSIPELDGVGLKGILTAQFPNLAFELENDANAAAIGELYFNQDSLPSNFLFITLGTGIGSAAVIDNVLFTGGDGNGLELGHIISRHGRRLEQNIGKQGILTLGAERLAAWVGDTLIDRNQPVSATKMVIAAEAGDEFSKTVWREIGQMLGEGLVTAIRILDIKTIIIGGGLSASFDFIMPGVLEVVQYYLTPYYTKDLRIVKASLGNDAGLQGAAALCFQKK